MTHYVIDDRTGFKVKAHRVEEEWTGRLTIDPDYRHPQEAVKAKIDKQGVPIRRMPTESFVSVGEHTDEFSYEFTTG